VVSFCIALFVLILQFLWKYIDDIVGKGLDISLIFELLFYLSLSLVPLALPLGVLLASVMVMGNLSEHYELASIKSAGIPLLRTMRPLIILVMGISACSYLFSNYIIPVANLKYQSRLYDIRKHKPTLNLEANVFNYDFKGFVMRIGSKDEDGRNLQDVLIYDHTQNQGNKVQIRAKKGEMYVTSDKKFFVIDLEDGYRYELMENADQRRNNEPHLRIFFKKWKKIFDLSQFELNRTDENLFKNHESMLSSRQLLSVIDSSHRKDVKTISKLNGDIGPYFYIRKHKDSLQLVGTSSDSLKVYDRFVDLIPKSERGNVSRRAKTLSKSVDNYVQRMMRRLQRTHESRIGHVNELHLKITMAIACLVFLFIGAPMGAIIRKGGFGWPLLISIGFFVAFIILNIAAKKLSENEVLPPWLAMWSPILILFPISLRLTMQAMRDAKIIQMDKLTGAFQKLAKKLRFSKGT